MTKKVLIVVICLVTVCAVLGLADRLTYTEEYTDENGVTRTRTGFEIAVEMVNEQSIAEFKVDLSLFEIMAQMIEDRGEGNTQHLMYSESDLEFEQDAPYIITYTFTPAEDAEETDDYHFRVHTYRYSNEKTARRFYNILSALEQFPSQQVTDGWWSDTLSAVNAAVYYIQVVFVAIMAVFEIIVDSFKIVFNVFEAAFYLLGF